MEGRQGADQACYSGTVKGPVDKPGDYFKRESRQSLGACSSCFEKIWILCCCDKGGQSGPVVCGKGQIQQTWCICYSSQHSADIGRSGDRHAFRVQCLS